MSITKVSYSMIDGALTNVKDFGASSTATAAANTTAINFALTTATGNASCFSPGNYSINGFTALNNSKIYGNFATLTLAGASQKAITLSTGLSLQAYDSLYIKDLLINCASKANSTGIYAPSAVGEYIASGTLDNIAVTGFTDYGFDLQNVQFIKTYNLKANLGTGTGLYLKAHPVEGGGNSNEFYGFQSIQNTVGVVLNGQPYTTGLLSNNFYNPQILSNSVCGMAFFKSVATLYGGAPEANATGAATATVDGLTIKRSSVYLNNSNVQVNDYQIGESTADPCFLLENGSQLTLKDCAGYGQPSGLLVSADTNSFVTLIGNLHAVGVIQNVASWPDSLQFGADQIFMYGQPVTGIQDSLLSRGTANIYAEQAPDLAPGGANAPTITRTEGGAVGVQNFMSFCTNVQFTAFAGSVNSNTAYKTLTGVAGQDTLFTCLVTSATDTTIGVNLFDGTNYNLIRTEAVVLKAGGKTRLVFGRNGIPSGTWLLFFYPIGADAPLIKFSQLQVYQNTAGSAAALADMAKIVKLGAFYPGVTREAPANIQDKTAAVNTIGKWPGKQIWDIVNQRVLYAGGVTPTSVWKDGANATIYTPV